MSDLDNLEKRSAQALIATYMQMTRYAELARSLQQARERSIQRRIKTAVETRDLERLQRQLQAQQGQGATISDAVQRFQARAKDLASFAEAGLTYEDFVHLGLENVVTPEHVEEAMRRKTEAPTEE